MTYTLTAIYIESEDDDSYCIGNLTPDTEINDDYISSLACDVECGGQKITYKYNTYEITSEVNSEDELYNIFYHVDFSFEAFEKEVNKKYKIELMDSGFGTVVAK